MLKLSSNKNMRKWSKCGRTSKSPSNWKNNKKKNENRRKKSFEYKLKPSEFEKNERRDLLKHPQIRILNSLLLIKNNLTSHNLTKTLLKPQQPQKLI